MPRSRRNKTIFGSVLSGLWPPAACLIGALLAYASARADPVAQTDFRLAFPVDCVVGLDCWIANYVDHDPGADAKDYTCGALTYDGHGGTDFAVRDFGSVRRGVAVLAAADGVVERFRDGMPDAVFSPDRSPQRDRRECGNGVVITHGRGWTTQYCHLKMGSVSVKPEQPVVQGQPIGMVGQSGKAEFPHVHFQTWHGGRTVDPFAGIEATQPCEVTFSPLWRRDLRETLKYRPFAIYNAGFAAGRPDVTRIRNGRPVGGELLRTAPALTLWVEVFGVQVGDQLRYRIIGPDGGIIHDRRITVARRYARWFGFSGRRRAAIWPRGEYVGEFTIIRQGLDGALTGTAHTETEIR